MENIDVFKRDIVIKANEELKKVNSNLGVQSVGGSSEKIYSLTTSFPLKGNKNIHNALKELGWETSRRFKVRADGG